jgi:hypothetical protein
MSEFDRTFEIVLRGASVRVKSDFRLRFSIQMRPFNS